MDLRQSTAGQVVTFGHALDITDGNTEENALTIANTDIKLHKHNTTVLVNKNSGGATNISNGVYHLTFDTTDSSTAGRLIAYIHVAGALAMKIEFDVLTQSAFDAKYTGTFNNLGGVAQTADNDILLQLTATATALADVPTVAEFNARTLLASAYFDPAADTVANVTLTATTTTNTDMRGTDSANTVVPPSVAQFNARTLLAASYFDPSADTVANVTTVATTTTNTDMRGTDGANTTTPPTTAQIWAETTRVLTSGANIVLAKGIGVINFNDITAAQVNAEMLDVLVTDTFAEVTVPNATASIKDMIHYTFSRTKNKTTQTATTLTVRNDADSGNLGTATVSDDSTTFTKGKET